MLMPTGHFSFVHRINKAIVYHILPTLCTLYHPFVADPFCSEWSLLLHDAIGDRMIPFAANALQCIVGGEENLQNCPSTWDFITCQRRIEPRPQATCT